MKKLLLIFLLSPLTTDSMEIEHETIKPDVNDLSTLREVYEYLIERNCAKPKESLAQVILENGWVLTNENNIIGMHIPRNRPTTNIAKSGIKADYESKKHAIIDLLMWQLDSGVSRSTDYFRHLIVRKYNSNPNYVPELIAIMGMREFRDVVE